MAILTELLSKLSGPMKRDLKIFLDLPSNQIANDTRKHGKALLEKLKFEKPVSDEELEKLLPKFASKTKKNHFKNQLSDTIKRYLIIKQVEDQPLLHNDILLSYFAKEGLNKNLLSLLKKSGKQFDEKEHLEHRDAIYNYWFQETKVILNKAIRQEDMSFSKMERALDEYFLLQKLRIRSERISRTEYGTDSNKDTLLIPEDILKVLDKENVLEGKKTLKAFFYAYKMIKEKDKSEQYAEELKKEIHAHKKEYSITIFEEISSYMINFYTAKINQGESSYLKEYIQFISAFLREQLAKGYSEISTHIFKNLLTLTLFQKDYEQTHKYMDEFANFLPDKANNEAILLTKGILAFQAQKYLESLSKLSRVEFKDSQNKFTSKRIELKSMYMLYLMGTFSKGEIRARIRKEKRHISGQKSFPPALKLKIRHFLTILTKMLDNHTLTTEDVNLKNTIRNDLKWVTENYTLVDSAVLALV